MAEGSFFNSEFSGCVRAESSESPRSAARPEWATKAYDLPRSGIPGYRVKSYSLRKCQVRWRRLWYAALRELRSCLRNIEILRTTGLHRQGLFDRHENLPSETHCFDCIQDIQTIEANGYPGLSRAERQIAVEAWLLAEKRFRNTWDYRKEPNIRFAS
jgi:hypothetical protein